jgi:hypothetical protein
VSKREGERILATATVEHLFTGAAAALEPWPNNQPDRVDRDACGDLPGEAGHAFGMP